MGGNDCSLRLSPTFVSRFRVVAILHRATLVPSKLELMASWLPSQSWTDGIDTTEISAVGAYRFDDPDGEVGVETHLLKCADGKTIQVPLTYRAAPLDAAASFLVGTTEHSVLGKRWVYDGCGDITYLMALVSTIVHGGHEAPLDVVTDDGLVRREATTKVTEVARATLTSTCSNPCRTKTTGRRRASRGTSSNSCSVA